MPEKPHFSNNLSFIPKSSKEIFLTIYQSTNKYWLYSNSQKSNQLTRNIKQKETSKYPLYKTIAKC